MNRHKWYNSAMRTRVLLWLLGQMRRLDRWIVQQTGDPASDMEAYCNMLDVFYDKQPVELTMLAAAYYERTKLDPLNAALRVVRGKGVSEYSFVRMGE